MLSLPLGDFLPDLPMTGLSECLNALPTAEGYTSVKGFASLTAALAADFQGGGAFVSSTGVSVLLAATSTDLYAYDGTAWVSKLLISTSKRWYFTQFNDWVIACNGTSFVKYDLIGGTVTIEAGLPAFKMVATVRDFVVGIQPGGNLLRVQWSGYQAPLAYTAGTNQSDLQDLGSGGEAMAVVGGEFGLVFQKGAIKRLTYVGDPLVFQIDEISKEVGCMASGSVVKAGGLTYFLSERGFMVTDGSGEPRPIGAERVDSTFFRTYSREEITKNITAAIDPARSLVMWAMPGLPGKLWCYNWVLDKWSQIELSLTSILTGFTSNTSLDALDATYPDDTTETGGIESVPYSLDDPRFRGGNPLLIVVNDADEFGTLTGSTLSASFELPWINPNGFNRARIRTMRAVGDAVCSGRIDARLELNDAEKIVTASSPRPNGKLPIRCNGRWLKPRLATSGNWSVMQGLELELEAAGGR